MNFHSALVGQCEHNLDGNMVRARMTGIIDVARAADVSPATVSRVFNSPRLVHPVTRNRVEKAVAELGYVRNRLAGSLHSHRSGTVGLIVPTVDNAIFAEMIQVFSTRLRDHGEALLVATHGYDLDLEAQLIHTLLEQSVDGLLLVGLEHRDYALSLVRSRDLPFMTVWHYQPDAGVPCIGVDNRLAGTMAANHLIELGHRDIACIFGEPAQNDRARSRLDGARAALARAGIEVPSKWQKFCRYSVGQAKDAAIGLMRGGSRPTAVIAGNDIIAQGVVYAAHACGLSVPRDLSVIGIGDFGQSAHMEPALTTIRIPASRIGRAAADAIKAKIDGETITEATAIQPQLLIRCSTMMAGCGR